MQDIQRKIIGILCDVKEGSLSAESLNSNSNIVNDAGIDSLQMINFMLKVEEEFGIEIDFDNFDFSHLESIQVFADYIAGVRQ